DKVVVESINVTGVSDIPKEEIVEGSGIELNQWYGSGEFKEELFDAGRDSMLLVCKSKGYLDASLNHYDLVYLPDSTFRFYMGRMVRPASTMDALYQQLNQDIASPENPMHTLAGQTHAKSSPYYRRFRHNYSDAGQAVPVPVITGEQQAADILNRLITYSDLRAEWVAALPQKPWNHPAIDSLLHIKHRTPFQDRRLVRLTLEETYPVLQPWDSIATSDLVRVDADIHEGRKYYAGSVHIQGNEVLTSPYLHSAVQLDSGEIFDYRRYEGTKKGMTDMYREEGYLFVRLDENREYQDSIVNLTFNVTEGLPAIIRRVEIKGNTRTKDKVIRREVQLFPGDTYRQSLMERSFREIYQLNYFDNLVPDIQPVEGSEQDVDLVFTVAEREAGTGTFSAGVAYSQSDGLTGTIGISIPNCCMGDGRNAAINLEYGSEKKSATLSFSEPWLRDRPITLGGSLNYTWTEGDDDDDDITRYGVAAYLGSKLTWPDDYFYGQLNTSLQVYNQSDNVDGSLVLFSGFAPSVGFTIIRDDKNLPMFPNEGSRFVWTLAKVIGSPLGDFNYWKNDFTLKWWFPLLKFQNQVLALGVTNEYGIIMGDALQYSALYQMGGVLGYQGMMRGYSSGSIGYRRLGRSYQFISAELTYPVAENRFYLLPFFFDAGNVFGQRYSPSVKVSKKQASPLSEWDPSSLKRDVGFGFRVIVPMLGTIGFDFAWPLDPGETYSGYDYSSVGDMEFNFLIGQSF
ncbi:MAG TPA: BamA/TamA family outer membrane protein, partial [Fibrobacteraceae bacterium]|nr:BamA/TamA family outer membrane protein [Fibrobacteraceae bacterium]